MYARFRSARPSDRLEALRRFYVDSLGCTLLGEFAGHAGFDGLIAGAPDASWQIEFVHEHGVTAPPPSSAEQLLVFYVEGRAVLDQRVAVMDAAGWPRTTPHNPYWARHGATYLDPDGYPVVIAVPHGQ